MQISEFQEMMRRLYFHRDSKRGIDGTYVWLVGEVRELGEALDRNSKKELAKEFADVIAWLASLANITEINLEKAALEKYSNKCPKCKQSLCQCTFQSQARGVSGPYLLASKRMGRSYLAVQ